MKILIFISFEQRNVVKKVRVYCCRVFAVGTYLLRCVAASNLIKQGCCCYFYYYYYHHNTKFLRSYAEQLVVCENLTRS